MVVTFSTTQSCFLQSQNVKGNQDSLCRLTTILALPRTTTLTVTYTTYILQRGSTALLYAAMNGHLAVVKILLRAGARDIPNEVNIHCEFSCTAAFVDNCTFFSPGF